MARRNYSASVVREDQTAIVIKGASSLVKQLQAIGTPTEAISKANHEIGQIVVRTGKTEAPEKTGALRRTIRAAQRRNVVIVRAGNDQVPYANVQHWGWFYDREWFIYRNIKPNPFLSRALGYNRKQIVELYEKNMDALIKKYGYPTPTKE